MHPTCNLTTDQRTTLSAASDTIAMLPLTHAADLSTGLACLSHTAHPDPADVRHLLTLAETVQRALFQEASTDRWLDETDDLPEPVRDSLIADLVAQREGQAEQVGQAIDVLVGVLTGVTAARAPIAS